MGKGKRLSTKKASENANSIVSDIPSLLAKARNCIDRMDNRLAIVYLQQAHQIQPGNIEVMDLLSNALMENGEDTNAFPLLVKSAQMDPDHNFEKWMYLGQLQNGSDAVTCYRKGIELLEKDIGNLPAGEDKQLLLTRLCGAYCSIGELYMTDL